MKLLWLLLKLVSVVPLFPFLVLFYAIVQPHTLIDPFRPGQR